jgi:protein SCO1/2
VNAHRISRPALAVLTATALSGLLVARGHAQRTPAPVSERSVYQLDSQWTTDAGRTLRLAELSGQYQIVAFIFTNCAGACPLLVKSLQLQARNLPARVRERARFVLVSIDPAQDTVTALRRYRKTLSLDEQWTLLRGNDADLRELTAILGFNYERMPDGQFAHSNLITLLNPAGEIVLQQPSADGALPAIGVVIGSSQ